MKHFFTDLSVEQNMINRVLEFPLCKVKGDSHCHNTQGVFC